MFEVVGRASFEVLAAGLRRGSVFGREPVSGIKDQFPSDASLMGGKDERQRLMVRIEQDEKGVVFDGIALGIRLRNGIAGQPHPTGHA